MSRLVDSQLTILLISAVFTVQMTGFNFYLFSRLASQSPTRSAFLLFGSVNKMLAMFFGTNRCNIGSGRGFGVGLEADPVGTGPNEALSKGLASVTKT